MWFGANNRAYTDAVVGTLAPPADLWVELQGKTSIGGDDGSAGVPLSANSMTIGWSAVAGATSYDIWRSVNGGTESFYANVAAPTTTFTDSAASGCVNGTAGPVGGVYYPANTYRYRVLARNANGAGSLTPTGQKYYVYNASKGGSNTVGGFKWWGDFTGSVTTTNYAASSPQETGLSWGNHPTGGSAYILPVCGGIYTHWNMWIGSIGTTGALYMDIYRTDVTTSFGLHGEIIGDLVIQPTGTLHPNQPGNLDVQAYIVNGPVAANTWQTHRIPISAFMTKSGTLQQQVYKFLLQINGGANADYYIDNVYYGE